MFRQVILSTTKSKIPAPTGHTSSMVHKEGSSVRSYVDETDVLVDKNSWRPRKSFSRSISLEQVTREEAVPKWKDVILSLNPRPQSAKVASSFEEATKEKERQLKASSAKVASSIPVVAPVSIQVERFKDNDDQDDDQRRPKSAEIKKRLHALASAFSNRSHSVKKKIAEPLASRSPSPPTVENQEQLLAIDEDWMVEVRKKALKDRVLDGLRGGAIDPQGIFYIAWLFVVCCAFLYNAWSIFLRSVFPYQTKSNIVKFMIIDYLLDTVYLVDMVLFKSRVRFIESGQLIEDVRLTRRHYMKSLYFKLDFLSLTPLDLLYFKFGPYALLRFPRILKIHAFWEFFDRIDAAAKSPYMIRIFRTLIYMMYLVHLNACAYYAMSVWEGLGSNEWVYNNQGNAYLRCFYFAIRTATSISGKMPKPNNSYEYVFMTLSWLLGVFVFAFLIGQIRDIVATATQNKTIYRHLMDQSIRYMENLNLPEKLQQKVRLWLNHTWEQQKTFDESKILNLLPSKMKTDLALSVHYQMLKKVQLLQECERTVIRDLVVKLKPVLFLPGDYICRKGEIGQEMYIINKGKVCVVEGSTVLVTLSEGSVLGEISVLGIPGCSRRNADVRSLGYSNLFVLSKVDLWDTLRSYPEAQAILRRKARKVMSERMKVDDNEEDIEVESIIKDGERPETPKMLRTVMQMMPMDSRFVRHVSRSSSMASINKSQLSLAHSSFDSSSFGGSYASVSIFNESGSSAGATSKQRSDELSESVQINSTTVAQEDDNVHPNIIEDIINACNSISKSA